jgi:hypothetical protein
VEESLRLPLACRGRTRKTRSRAQAHRHKGGWQQEKLVGAAATWVVLGWKVFLILSFSSPSLPLYSRHGFNCCFRAGLAHSLHCPPDAQNLSPRCPPLLPLPQENFNPHKLFYCAVRTKACMVRGVGDHQKLYWCVTHNLE